MFKEFKVQYNTSGAFAKLIIINCAVFIAINLVTLIFWLSGSDPFIVDKIITWFSVPASFLELLKQPWSLFTYMFVQKDLLHVLGNMLLFFFAGRMFEEVLGSRRLWATYILGGLAGALLYMISYNAFPVFQPYIEFSYTIGASASVLAVMVAIATLMPDMEVLFFFLPIRLKFLAIFFVILDLISIDKGNPGGHIAHLGGALWGYVYISQYKKGNDISSWFTEILGKIGGLFKRKSKLKVVHKKPVKDEDFNRQKKNKQERMDEILDKISKSGYESLSKEEKEFLFKISKDQ